jgi:hypothetical protein
MMRRVVWYTLTDVSELFVVVSTLVISYLSLPQKMWIGNIGKFFKMYENSGF